MPFSFRETKLFYIFEFSAYIQAVESKGLVIGGHVRNMPGVSFYIDEAQHVFGLLVFC